MKEYVNEEELRAELIAIKNDPNYSKERFGEMILLMCHRILRMPCYFKYSDLYKSDMISFALLKTFRYYKNFDENKISAKTNKPVKAFAYFTEIINMAYYTVLSKKGKEEKLNMKYLVEFSEQEFSNQMNSTLSYKNRNEQHGYNFDFNVVKEIVLEWDTPDFEDIKTCKETEEDCKVIVCFPKDFNLTIELFEELKSNLKTNDTLSTFRGTISEYKENQRKNDILSLADVPEEEFKDIEQNFFDEWMNPEIEKEDDANI